MSAQHHIIKRQVFELEVPSETVALDLRKAFTDLYEFRILPLMDKVFAQYARPGQTIRLKRLEIDLGSLSGKILAHEILPVLEAQLRKELVKKLKDIRMQEPAGAIPIALQLLFQYLETGKWPAGSGEPDEKFSEGLFLSLIQRYPQQVRNFLHDAARRPAVAKRIRKIASPKVRKELDVLESDETLAESVGEQREEGELSSERSDFEWVTYFLQHGNVPWWARKLAEQPMAGSLHNVLEMYPVAFRRFLRGDGNRPEVRRRIARQFDESLFDELLGIFPGTAAKEFAAHRKAWEKTILTLEPELTRKPCKVREWILELFVRVAVAEPTPGEFFRAWIRLLASEDERANVRRKQSPDALQTAPARRNQEEDTAPVSLRPVLRAIMQALEQQGAKQFAVWVKAQLKQAATLPTVTQDEQRGKQKKAAEAENKPQQPPRPSTPAEEFYIDNAGIVLMWPFLSTYFSTVGLLENERFVDENARERAVHLLQYLATGLDQPDPEYNLMLNKILCGYDAAEPLGLDFRPTKSERQESQTMLGIMIKHWSALGDLTIEGLRGSFFLRKGKLVREDEWVLYVEHQGYDLLLNKLPWGIGLIGLPWLKEFLHVKW